MIYAAMLKIHGWPCLVVGAGPIAARKAAGLIEAGARVTAVAPEFSADMQALAIEASRVKPFEPADLEGFRLVISATGVPTVDGTVFAAAESRSMLCNSADDPENCNFILPARWDLGDVHVAVSTNGQSPTAAQWLRDRLADGTLGNETEEITHILARLRDRIRGQGLSSEDYDFRSLLKPGK